MKNGTPLYWKKEILLQENSGLCRETVTGTKAGPACKFPCRDAFASFELYGIQPQGGSFAAHGANLSR